MVRSDSSCFVIPGKKLDGVFAGKHREAGVVFNRPLREFQRCCVAQLDIHLVAHVGDGHAVVVFDLAGEIEKGAFRATAFGQSQFAPGDFHDDWNEVLSPVHLEVIDLHGDGELCDRVLQHQGIFKLPFFVSSSELAEHLAGIIALAIIQIGG